MYEKHGDIEVVVEDTSWTSTDIYHYSIFEVKEANVDGDTVVALTNN